MSVSRMSDIYIIMVGYFRDSLITVIAVFVGKIFQLEIRDDKLHNAPSAV